MSLKMMLDQAENTDTLVEESINEATGTKQKNYFIEGVFSTIEMKNRNGRVYSRHLWEREVEKYQKVIDSNLIERYGEKEHPSRTTVDDDCAVILMEKLWIDGDKVLGRAKILNDNTDATNRLKAKIDEGMPISVSSRGVGAVSNTGIVTDFKLITYDVVSRPSDYHATMSGVVESAGSFMLNESGEIEKISQEDIEREQAIIKNNSLIDDFLNKCK